MLIIENLIELGAIYIALSLLAVGLLIGSTILLNAR